jgi:ribosomal protein S27E
MAKIKCEIIYDTEVNDYGTDSPCVRAICSKCQHETMSYGDSDSSVTRCLALMNEECPNCENNFYVADDEF